MGPYLAVPKKEKDSYDGENSKLRYGATGMQGWRNTMEDSHIAELDLGNGVSFFGVYDGHGGNEVADYVREHLIGELKKMDSFKNKDYRKALEDIYIKMDLDIQSTEGQEKLRSYQKKGGDQGPFGRGAQGDIADAAGCTACSALITPTEIWVANAGDSRAVIGKKRSDGKYEAFAMSEDHKPDNEGEKKRIEEAGGFVEDNRVRGILALSRSIGDLEYKVKGENKNYKKDMITADPEIKIQKIEPDVSFLIIACDGIWDCLDNQQAVDKVGDLIAKKPKLSQVVEDVFD